MNRNRPYYDVCWSPKDNSMFLTANCEEVRLYEVVALQSDGNVLCGASCLSEGTAAKLVWNNVDIKGIRCIDWFAKPSHRGTLLAVGCENGDINLTGYGADDHSLRGLDLNVKSSNHQVRQCNDIRWSPRDLKLACAFERLRGVPAVQVFDLEQLRRAKDAACSGETTASSYTCKSLAGLGHQDAVQSICFTPAESYLPLAIICGTSAHKLRLYDLRGPSLSGTSVSGTTPAIYGITFDFHNPDRFASFGTDCLCLWDLRSLSQPTVTLRGPTAQGISKLRWRPNRSNQLTVIQYDSRLLTLYTVRDALQIPSDRSNSLSHGNLNSNRSCSDADEDEASANNSTTSSGVAVDVPGNGIRTDRQQAPLARGDELAEVSSTSQISSNSPTASAPYPLHDHTVIRQLQPRGQLVLRSFSWHPEAENRLLIYDGGGEIIDYTLIDQITLNWAPSSEIIWTHDKRLVHRLHQADPLYKTIDPLAARVRHRAIAGFGSVKHATNICSDASLVKDDPDLLNLHHWLKQLESATCPENGGRALIGIFHLLENISGSTSVPQKLELDNSSSNVKYLSCYEHQARKQAIDLLVAIDGAYRGGADDWAQRALAALFQLNMRKVMEYLGVPSKTDRDLNSAFVALAISGYSEEKGSTWREMCATLKPRIQNAYLAAIFSFLMSTSDDYNQVLELPIALQDKLLFACRFLSDLKLAKFVKEKTAEYVQQGKLEGILLTGLQTGQAEKLNNPLLDLLQSHVDRTADVQTAAAIAVVTRDPSVLLDARTLKWIDSYRGLLNQWRLWTERALFDCAMAPFTSRTLAPQIRVHCNFCRKAILSNSDRRGRLRSAAVPQRITCCPTCRKPLPRCAMCLTNMGTPISRIHKDVRDGRGSDPSSLADRTDSCQFTRWFTWCQSCMHGGHTQHIAHWFERHEKCPVTGCLCLCTSVDISPAPLID